MLRLLCLLVVMTAVQSFLQSYEEMAIARLNALELSSRGTLEEGPSPTRRGFLSSSASGILAGTFSAFLRPYIASAAENVVDFDDATWKFSVKVPSGWEQSVQALPDRRKIILYIKPDSNQKTLCFIAYTPVRADFTSLGSFGSVDEVSFSIFGSNGRKLWRFSGRMGLTVISPNFFPTQVAQATILPKQEIVGVMDVSSKMLKAESKKQAYFFVSGPGQCPGFLSISTWLFFYSYSST